ncbi:MAG TPA: hypothetical protein VNE18_10390 [Rhodanobacter sp.]|nr:hypothetical protein [Rhodanobacter sp.]
MAKAPKPNHPRVKSGAHTAQLKKAVIAAYLETCTVSHACEQAKVGRRTFYDWMAHDPQFAAEIADVETTVADTLEKEAIRRGVKGVSEPVGWYQGSPGGHVQRYSDTLLIFLLKGHKPEKFADRHELSGPKGAPITITPVPTFTTPEAFAAWVASQQPSGKK